MNGGLEVRAKGGEREALVWGGEGRAGLRKTGTKTRVSKMWRGERQKDLEGIEVTNRGMPSQPFG